ncbi:kinase-like protein [Rhizophagus irregularis]|uniref:Kinase-like protein n=1 Tax=Rhizophagus irregularis TaxID=588596 RepID=A0A2N0NQB8_9GLOM|nr:kinase-like protein [Rhizophagus irregularis]
MELIKLVNTIDESSFDPTPKLKSSPVPIFFVSFIKDDKNCINCGEEYTQTIIYDQKYCKKCLSCYLTNITDNNLYLDVYLLTKELECSKHEINRTKVPKNIQECCRNCLTILCFKQIIGYNTYIYRQLKSFIYKNVFKSEKYCKLCGKLLYKGIDDDIIDEFKLCSDCYLFHLGRIESTFNKNIIEMICLPWWENTPFCYCNEKLVVTSDCQKYCKNCFIFFIGCRYCLTTNIIFGITNQSQCKKCKRVSTIILDLTNIYSGNSVLDDFLFNIRHDQLNISKVVNNLKCIDKYYIPYKICYNALSDKIGSGKFMKYIPYSQFTNVKEITEGGFSIVYQATLLDCSKYDEADMHDTRNRGVILKRFKNPQYVNKYFLNELRSNHHCYDRFSYNIIRTFGFTKDPKWDEGDLHKYLQKKFTEINWEQKISILYDISLGLQNIHRTNFVHRDLHSGNILVDLPSYYETCKIGDLGLSRHANGTSSDNEIYGVIPYIAPEIFKGSAFSKESDIYSLGMIMWELTTGCKPFTDVEHDHSLIFNILDGARPEITEDTPECYTNLMKSCWDSDPEKRPSIVEICDICNSWIKDHAKNFTHAELKRKKLIKSKKLGPKFAKKPHPKSIYISRSLNSYISKCSSINFSSNDYISNEIEFDIDIESNGSNVIKTKRNIKELSINSCENNVIQGLLSPSLKKQ